jgi:hypothetical protein
MKEQEFVYNGDNYSYRIDLNKVEAFSKGVHTYLTGLLGLGKPGTWYLIEFHVPSGRIDWKFDSEKERDSVFERLEARVRLTQI